MITHIVGIDCAVKDENMGLALARWTGAGAVVQELVAGPRQAGACAEIIAGWLERYPRSLLALDSPLGWPQPLPEKLARHSAGEPIPLEADVLFRRETDRFIRRRHGKQTLDVGADRIARTAVAALDLLQSIRNRTGLSIPLAWDHHIASAAAIEVYPGQTLRVHGLWEKGYRKAENVEGRQQVLERIQQHLRLDCDPQIALHSVDVLDAIACVLAGIDFLQGKAEGPEDEKLALKEGWTWVRAPQGME